MRLAFTPPVDALDPTGRTLWGNLGDWSDARDYADAARSLATRLGAAAGLDRGHRVVDLGCGAGDQLRLWVEAFAVDRVVGIERDAELATRAATRIREWGLKSRIRVLHGDAVTTPWADESSDRVVALDSVYFFRSRPELLRRCRASLRPGGLLAVTDLLIGAGARSGRVAGTVAPLFGVRRDALLTERRYRSMLLNNGFDDLRIHDCTDDVLGGFARWARGGGPRRDGVSSRSVRLGLAMTGWVSGWLTRSTGLRYVVVTARRAVTP